MLAKAGSVRTGRYRVSRRFVIDIDITVKGTSACVFADHRPLFGELEIALHFCFHDEQTFKEGFR